jgi:hypothetical protein
MMGKKDDRKPFLFHQVGSNKNQTAKYFQKKINALSASTNFLSVSI